MSARKSALPDGALGRLIDEVKSAPRRAAKERVLKRVAAPKKKSGRLPTLYQGDPIERYAAARGLVLDGSPMSHP